MRKNESKQNMNFMAPNKKRKHLTLLNDLNLIKGDELTICRCFSFPEGNKYYKIYTTKIIGFSDDGSAIFTDDKYSYSTYTNKRFGQPRNYNINIDYDIVFTTGEYDIDWCEKYKIEYKMDSLWYALGVNVDAKDLKSINNIVKELNELNEMLNE